MYRHVGTVKMTQPVLDQHLCGSRSSQIVGGIGETIQHEDCLFDQRGHDCRGRLIIEPQPLQGLCIA
jgi:hypothetical protein